MINPKRVRRIKQAIYLLLVLLFLTPLVLFIILSVKMLRLMPELSRMLAEKPAIHVQVQGQSAAPPSSAQPAPEPFVSETSQLPVPQGASQAEPAADQEVSQPEIPSPPEIEVQGNPPATALTAGSQTPESLPEQTVTRPPYGDIQSPNTGLPR